MTTYQRRCSTQRLASFRSIHRAQQSSPLPWLWACLVRSVWWPWLVCSVWWPCFRCRGGSLHSEDPVSGASFHHSFTNLAPSLSSASQWSLGSLAFLGACRQCHFNCWRLAEVPTVKSLSQSQSKWQRKNARHELWWRVRFFLRRNLLKKKSS
jgi:hypothetical protein